MYPILHIGTFSLYTFGLCVGSGIVLSYRAFEAYRKRAGLPVSMLRLFLVCLPVGFCFARLDGTALTTSGGFVRLVHAPLSQLCTGGLTYMGGMLATLAASIGVIVLSQWPLLRVLDASFCASVGYAIGRVGCFLAGDGDYGVASAVPWAMSFPHGVVPTSVRVHPTMLYSTLWELVVFALLWRLSDPKRVPELRPGTLLGLYLIATSAGRFLVEMLSRNGVVAYGLTEAQVVSIVLFVVGVVVLACVWSGRSLPVEA